MEENEKEKSFEVVVLLRPVEHFWDALHIKGATRLLEWGCSGSSTQLVRGSGSSTLVREDSLTDVGQTEMVAEEEEDLRAATARDLLNLGEEEDPARLPLGELVPYDDPEQIPRCPLSSEDKNKNPAPLQSEDSMLDWFLENTDISGIQDEEEDLDLYDGKSPYETKSETNFPKKEQSSALDTTLLDDDEKGISSNEKGISSTSAASGATRPTSSSATIDGTPDMSGDDEHPDEVRWPINTIFRQTPRHLPNKGPRLRLKVHSGAKNKKVALAVKKPRSTRRESAKKKRSSAKKKTLRRDYEGDNELSDEDK
eukprot:g14410.t1